MRVMSSAPGDWVADQLGLTGEGRPRWALKVISGFGFSGVTHMGLVPPLIENAATLRWQIAGFFWMQGLGVLLESGVGMVWEYLQGDGKSSRKNKSSSSVSMRTLRLAWVLTWICFTIPLLRDPFRDLGWWKLYPLPEVLITPRVQRLLDGSWLP